MKQPAPGSFEFSRLSEAKTLRELLACVREFEAAPKLISQQRPRIRLAITGNYSTQFLSKAFPLMLAARDIDADVYETPYDQWQIESLNILSPLYKFGPSHILLLLSSTELIVGNLKTPEAIADAVADIVQSLLGNTSAQIFFTLPEALAEEITDWSGSYAWRREVNRRLRSKLTSSRITLIDLDPLIRAVGNERWFDDRFYDSSKIPFHPDQTPALLACLSDAIAGSVAPRCKLVITDLDGTFWGGTLGDDGWEGLDLDRNGGGRHFLRYQFFLASLKRQGVILAIASKNDAAPVKEAFERRQELLLRFDDFVDAEIHWEPKSTSVARILQRLQLSTAGVVFLDDNPVEREEVRRNFPDLIVPDLPEDPANRVQSLSRTGIFDRRVVTNDSLNRSQMYAENANRERAKSSAGNLDDFLQSLDMVLESQPVSRASERVLELIHKTNQFNLTTRRYSWDEVDAIAKSGLALCYRLTDKFGDNGIISVILVARKNGTNGVIKLWLMSCRVLGRRVEQAILADVARRCPSLGIDTLIGEYIRTAKNDLVKNLYPDLGFNETERAANTITYARDLAIALPSQIRYIDLAN